MPTAPRSSRWRPVPEFDAVAFDAYGTLFDVTGENWAPREVVVTMRAKQLQYSWMVSLMGGYSSFRDLTRAAVEHALEAHGHQVNVDAVMESMLHIRPYPEVPAALERMAGSARLAILSNGDPPSLEALLENAGLRDRFTWVVSAEEVRVFKPAPAVYQRLLARTEAPRERLLFVSSNGFDVAGAAAAGLRVAWVNRTGAAAERVGGRPELPLGDLTELAARFAAQA